ncbi:MAG TPA: hypothetical protein PLO33_05600 [Kouleothrix sp.]|uniref:hypothetical protein n=1 Tax=Kouleothrix sp. TaxID=2779161 RepID=UPI002BAFE535|nr:hypothetical protein [Kouleothrix sp.]HRC75131.1 hypothetical protein [Kouleothrix sp.]
MRDNKDILQQYVSDMIALDKHIVEAVERQLNDERLDTYPGARQLVGTIKRTLTAQVDGLQQQLASVGGEASGPVKETLSAVAGVAAGLYDKVRHDPVSKMLRDDYTALSLASVGYTMLHTTGLALKHTGIANMAVASLKELTPLVVDISKLLPMLVVKDLAGEEVSLDESAGPAAVRNTQAAWGRENTGK